MASSRTLSKGVTFSDLDDIIEKTKARKKEFQAEIYDPHLKLEEISESASSYSSHDIESLDRCKNNDHCERKQEAGDKSNCDHGINLGGQKFQSQGTFKAKREEYQEQSKRRIIDDAIAKAAQKKDELIQQ